MQAPATTGQSQARQSSNEPVLVGSDEGETDGPQSAWVLINYAASSTSSDSNPRPESQNQSQAAATATENEAQPSGEEEHAAAAAAEELERERARARALAAERAKLMELQQRRADLERKARAEQVADQERLERASRVRKLEELREQRAFRASCQRERQSFLTNEEELRRTVVAAESADRRSLWVEARPHVSYFPAVDDARRPAEAQLSNPEWAFELSDDEPGQPLAQEIAEAEALRGQATVRQQHAAELEALRMELTGLQTELDRTRDRATHEVKILRAQVQARDQELVNARAEIVRLHGAPVLQPLDPAAMARYTHQVADLRAQVEARDKEIANLRQAVAASQRIGVGDKAAIVRLNADVAALDQQLATVRQAETDLRTRLHTAETELAQRRAQEVACRTCQQLPFSNHEYVSATAHDFDEHRATARMDNVKHTNRKSWVLPTGAAPWTAITLIEALKGPYNAAYALNVGAGRAEGTARDSAEFNRWLRVLMPFSQLCTNLVAAQLSFEDRDAVHNGTASLQLCRALHAMDDVGKAIEEAMLTLTTHPTQRDHLLRVIVTSQPDSEYAAAVLSRFQQATEAAFQTELVRAAMARSSTHRTSPSRGGRSRRAPRRAGGQSSSGHRRGGQ